MNKILIEVICAATDRQYDFWIPKKMPADLVLTKLAEDISEFEKMDQLFPKPENLMLYSQEQQIFLDGRQTMTEAGIKGGDRLILI